MPICNPKLVLAVEELSRSDKLLDFDNLLPIEVVTVVEKSASSPRAVTSSFKVSNVVGALSTKLEISVFTKAVEAILVELSVDGCVTTY